MGKTIEISSRKLEIPRNISCKDGHNKDRNGMDLTEAEDIKKRWQEYTEVKSLSRVRLFATPWTVAYQAPLSMGFSKQECWSGLPFPSPGDLPDPGIEPGSPSLQADALPSEPPGKPQILQDNIKISTYLLPFLPK